MGSNPAIGVDVLSVVSVVCFLVEVSVSGSSLVQKIPTKCACLIECDHESLTMRRPWPTRAVVPS